MKSIFFSIRSFGGSAGSPWVDLGVSGDTLGGLWCHFGHVGGPWGLLGWFLVSRWTPFGLLRQIPLFWHPSTSLLLSPWQAVEIAPLAALAPTGPDSAILAPLHFPITFSIENR